jgi:hypothetical protein
MYYVPMPMNKLVAWESAVSWAIITLERSIERMEAYNISTSYDRARQADLLELQSQLQESLQQWMQGEVSHFVMPEPTETV